jgi:hypothetical protein
MQELKEFVNVFNSISPLAIIGGMVYTGILILKKLSAVSTATKNITENHLHDLPEIVETLREIKLQQAAGYAAILGQLSDVRETLGTILGKLNGSARR